MIEVLSVNTTAIVSRYINVSNQHIVHLKFIQYYMPNISNLKKKKWTSRKNCENSGEPKQIDIMGTD